MFDSGAFGVWNAQARGKKVSIDLDEYCDFCLSYPKASYYVNLDVIPGVPGDKSTLTRKNVEQACQQGWENYRQMVQTLGVDKVIPVYHQNDDKMDGSRLYWLERYLNYHTPYLGISPANDMTTDQKIEWMRKLKPYLFKPNGDAVVKTHGFAVTSYRLMKEWQWYSVDSASWKQTASNGAVYFPKGSNDNFTDPPLVMVVSPHTQKKQGTNKHYNLMSKGVRKRFCEWLTECGVGLGRWKRDPNILYDDEIGKWWEKKKPVYEEEEPGVMTSFEERCKVNIRFMKLASKALRENVRHIYFAGALMPYACEYDIQKRLLSYNEIGKSESACKRMEKHLRLKEKERVK